MLGTTLLLYRDAMKEAGRGFGRSAMVWPLPLLILVALKLVWFPLSLLGAVNLGILGGLIHFVLETLLYGAYLFLVGEALSSRRRLGLADIRDSLGRNMRELIGLLFVFWILQIALVVAENNGQISAQVRLATLLGVAILFNPGPEIVHQERSVGSMDILVRAFRWMSSNAPEWLPNLVITAGLVYALDGSRDSWFLLLVCGLVLHPWMLFRGALYRSLGEGSRRTREWRSRF